MSIGKRRLAPTLTVWWLVLAALPAAACVDGPGPANPIPVADFELYVQSVQPVLESRCSERNCHGNAARPLGLYAGGRHRIDGYAADPEAPLVAAELRANFDRARSFIALAPTADACELVSKPLAVAAGGVGHDAGTVFTSTIDDEYLDIFDWIEDAIAGSSP